MIFEQNATKAIFSNAVLSTSSPFPWYWSRDCWKGRKVLIPIMQTLHNNTLEWLQHYWYSMEYQDCYTSLPVKYIFIHCNVHLEWATQILQTFTRKWTAFSFGLGCLRNMARSGKASQILRATAMLAISMNSSINLHRDTHALYTQELHVCAYI